MSMTRVHPNDLAPLHEPEPPEEVALPEGTRFYQLTVIAESWNEWDRLLSASPFELCTWWVNDKSERVNPETDHAARRHEHLERAHGKGRVVIQPPPFSRPVPPSLPVGVEAEDFGTGASASEEAPVF